jgi:hypothetical protein
VSRAGENDLADVPRSEFSAPFVLQFDVLGRIAR